MRNILEKSWKTFLQNLNTCVFVKKIKMGINDTLLEQLKKSQHYNFRANKIPKMAEARAKEWAEARRGELEMEAHYKALNKDSSFKILSSISHTQNLVVGASCMLNNQNDEFQGVGIDIENSKRNIDPEVVKRFMSASSLSMRNHLAAIDYWVLKEAAFKATPRDLQLVITGYDLIQWDEKSFSGVMSSKNAKCQVKLVKIEDYTFGLSYFRY